MSYTSETSGIIDHAFLKNLYNAHHGYGVLSGMTLSVTGSSLVVTIASGTVRTSSGVVVYAGGTVTCGAGHATLPRMDAIIWDTSANAPAVLAGTATAESATQSKPPLTDLADSDDLLLGMAYITATATTIPSGNLFQRGIQLATPTSVIKQSDESVTSSITLQNDDELLVALDANTFYTFEALLGYTGAAAGDLKVAFTVPAGAAILVQGWGFDTPFAVTPVLTAANGSGTALNFGCNGTTVPVSAKIQGAITTAATAGNLQLQFAQVSSNGTATTMKAGSRLDLHSLVS